MSTRHVFAVALAAAVGSAIAEPVVFDVGEGNETNVTECIGNWIDGVAIESGTVNLLSDMSAFTGDVVVNGGTLGMGLLRPFGRPSSIGFATNVVMAPGTTLRYLAEDPGVSDAAITFDAASAADVFTVDTDSDFTMRGAMLTPNAACGRFVKTGSGTFTIATASIDGASNCLGRAESGNTATIDEGTLAIATDSSVTTILGGTAKYNTSTGKWARYGQVKVGSDDHDASLDLISGKYFIADAVSVGAPGRTTSLNVYGGTLRQIGNEGYIRIGNVTTDAAVSGAGPGDSSLNIYGGDLTLAYVVLTMRRGTKGRMFISGGKLDAKIYGAHDSGGTSLEDQYTPEMEINVCSNGTLKTSYLQLARGGISRAVVRVFDGGTLHLTDRILATKECDGTLILDGGTVRFTYGGAREMIPSFMKIRVGAAASTIEAGANYAYTVNGTITSDVDGGTDGGLILAGGTGSITFSNSPTYTGPTVLESGTKLNIKGNLSLASLVAGSSDIDLLYTVSSASLPLLTIGGFNVPGVVRVSLSGSLANGTYDIISAPAVTELDVSRFQLSGASESQGVRFAVRTEGGRKIVSLALFARNVVNSAWQNADGGAWETAGNWDVAPLSSPDARVAFATAASVQDSAVTIASPVTVGGMTLSADPGYSISGQTVTLDNAGVPAAVAATAGENTIEAPLQVPSSVNIDASAGAELNVSGAISGDGFVTVNSPASGSGTVVLSGANTFTKGIRINSGTAQIRTIADSGVPSPLGAGSEIVIWKGTLDFAGGVGSTDRAVTLNVSDKYRSAGIFVAEGSSLVLRGPVTNPYGALHKRGKGELTLAGAREYTFGKTIGSYEMNVNYTNLLVSLRGGDGIPPIFGGLIGAGRMVWGEPGQTVAFPNSLCVGTVTTMEPGLETDAELVINGGDTTVKYLYVGNTHGFPDTAEHSVLTNRLTLNGGTLTAYELTVGAQPTGWRSSVQHSEVVVNGGTLAVTHYTRLGREADADGLSTARVIQNGGLIDLAGSYFTGSSSNPPHVTYDINGGVFQCRRMRYSYATKSRTPHAMHVNEGATLRVLGAIDAGGTTSTDGSYVAFDGGIYQPGGSAAVVDISAVIRIGEKGMVIDTSILPPHLTAMMHASTSRAGGSWITDPSIAEDGGIAVQGSSAIRAVVFDSASGYSFSGPVVVKAGGALYVATTAFDSKRVTVKDGGVFGAYCASSAADEATVSSLALEDGATVAVGISAANRSTLRATGSLSQAGTVYAMAGTVSTNDCRIAVAAGTYPVLRGPVGSLDASKFALSPEYGVGVSATFALVNGDGYDEVQMTLNAPAQEVVPMDDKTWTSISGGVWAEPSNWDYAPLDSTKDRIVFPATLQTPATIDLGGSERTLGAIASHAEGEVTLGNGSLSLSRYEQGGYPVVSNTVGTLVLPDMNGQPNVGGEYAIRLEPSIGATQVISGTITSNTRIYANTTRGAGGTIRIASPQTTWIDTNSGTVEGAPEDLGTATYVIGKSTFRFTSGGVSEANISGSDGLNLHADGDVYSYGKISNDVGPFIKTGKGAVYLLSRASTTLSSGASTEPKDNTTMAWQMPANGDVPTGNVNGERLAAGNIAAGKLVLGLTGGTTTFAGHMRLGCSITDFDENGDVLDSEIEVRGGNVAFNNDLYIGRNCGFYRQYRDSAKKRNATFSVYGGNVTMGGMYLQHDGTGYFNGNATFNLYGGTVKSTSGYIIFNNSRTTKMTANGQSHAYINIYGGIFTNTYFSAAREYDPTTKNGNGVVVGTYLGGLQSRPFQQGDLDLNLFGGEFAFRAALYCDANADAKVRINLAGGRLTARYMRRHVNGGSYGIFWNGGTYRPTMTGTTLKGQYDAHSPAIPAGYAWSYNTCSTNGANFEIPAGNTFTLDQALTHDADLGGELDGGIASVGEGTLVLGVANTFTGPVKAKAGTMRVEADGAIPSGVALELSGGTLDLNGHDVTVGDVTGNGGWVRNGTVTVNGMVSVGGDAGSWVGMDAAVFGAGAMFVSRCAYSSTSQTWTGDFMKLGGSATGTLIVDLGRSAENPLPKGSRIKIAELPTTAAFPAVRVMNWGDETKTSASVSRTVDGDTAEIYVEIIGKGAVLTLR